MRRHWSNHKLILLFIFQFPWCILSHFLSSRIIHVAVAKKLLCNAWAETVCHHGEIWLIQNPSHRNTSFSKHTSHVQKKNIKRFQSTHTDTYITSIMDYLTIHTHLHPNIKHRSQSVFPSLSSSLSYTHNTSWGIRCIGCGLSICGCVCRLPGWGNKRTRWLILTATTCYARNRFLTRFRSSN